MHRKEAFKSAGIKDGHFNGCVKRDLNLEIGKSLVTASNEPVRLGCMVLFGDYLSYITVTLVVSIFHLKSIKKWEEKT